MQDTDAVPFESGPGGTRVTYTSGQAAFGAARDLRDKLLAVAAELLEGPVESVQLSQGRFVLAGNPQRALSVAEVVAQATAGTGSPLRGDMSVTSTPPHVTSFCAQAAEVEVDPDTGQVTVKKIVTAHDVGTILNPLAHQGQIEGGLMQGFGYALMEELRTEDGQISTLSLGEYKVPTIKDIPELVTVLLEPEPGSGTVRGQRHRRKQQHPGGRCHRQRHLRRRGRAGDGLAAHGGKGVCCFASEARRVDTPRPTIL